MSISKFDAVESHLERGVNLIEASAGTGKTYTIAMLVLRFVVEQDISIEQQLVVTFTRAATDELRVRIRARLRDALNLLLNPEAEHDPELIKWSAQLIMPQEVVALRLRTALVDIDRASIFTIHGLCQHLLREFPLDGKQQFEQELLADTSEIMRNIVDDFWRREFYARPKEQVAVLRWRYSSPEQLYGSVKNIDWRKKIYPDAQGSDGLQSVLEDLSGTAANLQSRWETDSDELHAKIFSMVEEGCFIKGYGDSFEYSWQQLDRFCRGSVQDIPEQSILEIVSLEVLDSDKGLKKKHRDLASSIIFEPLEQYVAALEKIQLCLRRQLLEYFSKEYESRMEHSAQLSFDSLIVRMGLLLEDDKSGSLKNVIQKKYQVALIDEFQDTDQTQWSIFSKLFGEQKHYLYLIGDPKQAIYKFRGADIFSYFMAMGEATRTYTLENNWRSTPPLVESINTIFSECDNPFLFKQLKFHKVSPAKSLADGYVVCNGTTVPPMILWQLPKSEQKNGFWSATKAGALIGREVVAEILNLIDTDSKSKIIENAIERAITPADIAILVRSHKQAITLQTLLATEGITSVHRGSANIFSSDEAQDLLKLLQAVANPGDLNLLKNLLTISWSGLNGQELYAILESDHKLGEWFEDLHQLHSLWSRSGVMAMVGEAVNKLLIHHIASDQNAERVLTNINHLAELLQWQADNDSLSIHKTVAWLQGEIHENSSSSEESMSEQQLRLESDDKALQIITMHSSKGLEFPIVFAPYLWQRPNFLKTEKNRISCHESGRLITDIGSEAFESRREAALREELAEELRLLYVALTRAKYRCYLSWGDVRTTRVPNKSALAYLLFSDGRAEWGDSIDDVNYEQQQQVLSLLSTQFPDQFDYCELPLVPDVTANYSASSELIDLSARKFTRRFDRSWQMSSYSALVHISSSHAIYQLPEAPEDKSQEVSVVDYVVVDSELPKGAHFGNVLHEMLELQPFDEIAQGNIDGDLRDRLSHRFNLELERPHHFDQLLQRVVTTPLINESDNFTLADIEPSKTLKEMPFYLSMENINTAQINRLLAADKAVSPLPEIDLAGYLTGFIDLVFEHNGKFYILDYKSNYLESYATSELERAMHQHNYGLQYWIYSVVLHRYLKCRVSNYRYSDHFGGALYLFVRGMDPEHPESGVYRTKPDETILMEFNKMMGGE